jgi:uncharacterized protein (DUF885 family)
MRLPCLLLLSVALTACAHSPVADTTADARLKALYEREWSWRQQQRAQLRDSEGEWVPADHLPDVTAKAQRERLRYQEAVLAQLAGIPREELSDTERVNAAVFEQIITTEVSNARYRTYEAPLNSDTFFWGDLHPQQSGFDDLASYERYLGRLRDLPRYFSQHQENMRAGLERGFTPPAITLAGRDGSIEPYLKPGADNPFAVPLQHFPQNMSAAERGRIEEEILEAIDAAVVPAYSELLAFMREEYLPNARTTLAARRLPDGKAFYQSQILAFTTLDLTPEEIHQRGLAEVARIRTEMLAILAEVDFDGDLAAFFTFLRTDPQFYAKTAEELMGVSAYVDKRMDAHIGDVLGFLPRKRLTLHECSPGHALQAAIAREAPGEIPEFRAHNYFSGYGEGWGLYTEWLGGELGIYRTPFERFGQLTYEMWRACRLVIDTGVHHYGWTREQAQDYLRNNAALSEHEITTEIDRYISWPAQALAYKLGEMLIREKRASGEATLGTDFDQRYFHDKILALRSVPLWVLGDELDAWIANGGPNPYAGMDIE